MNEQDLYLKGKMDAMSALNKYFEDGLETTAGKFAKDYLDMSISDAHECKVPLIINFLNDLNWENKKNDTTSR